MPECMESVSKAMKTATVLTLSYNSPDLICAIDSVLMQTYGNIQYIIVDDGSREFDKEKILKHIAGKNRGNICAEIIVNKENKGIIKSSNLGLRIARGDYIINLAGDDCFYDERVVEDVVAEFERRGALVLTGYCRVCDFMLHESRSFRPSKRQAAKIKSMRPQELFEEMAGGNFILGCCTAYSKGCFESYGYYDETYRNLDDYTFHMRLLREGVKFEFFDRIFVRYRQGGVSAVVNIKEDYLRESTQIFENEILPYSLHPRKAQKHFDAWKKHIEAEKRYAQRKEQYQGKRVRMLVLKGSYYLAHPRDFVLVLLEKMFSR